MILFEKRFTNKNFFIKKSNAPSLLLQKGLLGMPLVGFGVACFFLCFYFWNFSQIGFLKKNNNLKKKNTRRLQSLFCSRNEPIVLNDFRPTSHRLVFFCGVWILNLYYWLQKFKFLKNKKSFTDKNRKTKTKKYSSGGLAPALRLLAVDVLFFVFSICFWHLCLQNVLKSSSHAEKFQTKIFKKLKITTCLFTSLGSTLRVSWAAFLARYWSSASCLFCFLDFMRKRWKK